MKIAKKLFIIFGIVLICIVLYGCAKNTKNNAVTIGYFNNVTHAQALYMKAQGLLEDQLGEDFKVKWVAFNAGPAEVEALFAGEIDLGYIGPVPAITANVKSHGDILILSGATKAGAELIKAKGSKITKISDLSGKIIAIPQIGNTQHLCLLKLLSDNGLATVENGGSVTVTAVDNADVQNLMDRGNIDAAFVPEPWGSTLVGGGAEIMLDYDEVYMSGDYPVAVVVVRKEFLENNPEFVEQFLKLHSEITDKASKAPDSVRTIVNEEINNATGKSLSENILAMAFRKILFSTDVNEAALEDFASISIKEGFISSGFKNILVK